MATLDYYSSSAVVPGRGETASGNHNLDRVMESGLRAAHVLRNEAKLL
jgi:hypothetical protein